jgi:deazaflavin-dependent oxidoreductase (nitroreductase family)
MPGFGVVIHRGRHSGRRYQTPVVNVFPAGDGYVIALTYGPGTDWVKNVLAAGGCELQTRGHTIRLTSPQVFRDESRRNIRPLERQVLRVIGVADFLSLKRPPRQPQPLATPEYRCAGRHDAADEVPSTARSCRGWRCFEASGEASVATARLLLRETRDMSTTPLLQKVDAVTIPVPDLEAGLRFYRDSLGHELLWRNDAIGQAGLGMPSGGTEIVLTTQQEYEPNWLVTSAADAAAAVQAAGGRVVAGPFDIPVGRVAVVADPFDNILVLLDLSKGHYVTDKKGNVTAVAH